MITTSRAVVGALALALAGAGATAITASPAAASPGSTMSSPAASCWEIKQTDPASADGAYWLLTPAMAEPRRYYCDMTTDGGGWVLVAKGRDSWTTDYDGTGDPAQLVDPATVPMSAATHQLPGDEVDALLGGGRVDTLTEGVRLRRATNVDGTAWQEVRIRFAKKSRWTWTFGAEHPLAGYSIDATSRNGGSSPSFGVDNAFRRVYNSTTAGMGYRTGFAYGGQVVGSTSPTSYLYSATGGGNALPYTQVYLRPRLFSDDPGFTAIPDAGTPAKTRPPVPRSTALASPWGVTGTAGSTSKEGNVEVQTFTQSGDRMYVGGNFRYVQRDQAGTDRVEQPFLAAFDVDTGEWVPSFRPVLDEQVRALATLPSGEVLAGGDFTNANGAPVGALVALDPDTGATSTTWQATFENRISGGTLRVNTLDVAGPYAYVGGALTHVTGGTRTWPVYMRSLARLSSADGTPSTDWNPEFNGSVVSVDATDDLSRVYAAGYFTTSNGNPALKAAALTNDPGAPLATPTWSPVWSANANYQQAIRAVGDRLWVGGSEHNLFQYDPTTFDRVAGNIFKRHGDVQAITDSRGVVYAGCHCQDWDYYNAYTWPNLGNGWTEADAMSWVGAWDADTGLRIPQFTPTWSFRLNQGIWAIRADTTGTLWAGGDVATVRTNAQQARWSGGFARFPLADATAPTTPTSFRVVAQDASTVTLGWAPVGESGVRYQVLRDDRPVAVTSSNTVTLPRGGLDRYFVRAVDAAGNISASTEVLVAVPEEGTTDNVVVPRLGSWHYWYRTEAPAAGWKDPGFDTSAWSTGTAVLGFGTSDLGTDIDTFADPSQRPLTAYFTTTFEVPSAEDAVRLALDAVADDGFVVYVNGTEVARSNMPDGPVTHTTYASSARNATAARTTPVLVDVAPSLLVDGTNTIAVETHLNYRRTRDVSFDLAATLTTAD